MPGTLVEMALVSPPFSWPGLGLNVSNWLGPPPIHNRMQAMPRLRRSSADRQMASVQLITPAAAPLAAATTQKVAPMNDAVTVRPRVDVMLKCNSHGLTPFVSKFLNRQGRQECRVNLFALGVLRVLGGFPLSAM